MYTDDILIFVNGGKRSIRRLVEILGVYEGWPGQLISKEKSALFLSRHISSSRTRALLRLTGFREGKFSVTYLGALLMSGRLTTRIIEPFVEKVRKKVTGWKFKLLSQGGRLILLRHVLASMPIHILSVINVPLATIASINSLLSNFFWGHVNGISKMKWRAWSKLCLPTGEGGLGVRDFKEVQHALHKKFAFRLMSTNSLWTDFFRAKYIKDSHISLATGSHRGSRFWKSILSVFPEVYDNVKVLV